MTALPVVGQRIRISRTVGQRKSDYIVTVNYVSPEAVTANGGRRIIRATTATGTMVEAFADQWEPLPDHLTVGELADLLTGVDRDMPVAVPAGADYVLATKAWVLPTDILPGPAGTDPAYESTVGRFVIERCWLECSDADGGQPA